MEVADVPASESLCVHGAHGRVTRWEFPVLNLTSGHPHREHLPGVWEHGWTGMYRPSGYRDGVGGVPRFPPPFVM